MGKVYTAQTKVLLQLNGDFLCHIDKNLRGIGYSDRSSFIRDAIAEKLRAEGVATEAELSLVPSRAGKGGRPTHTKYPAHRPGGAELNEKKKG